MERTITETLLEEYSEYLYEEEKSKATIRKYLCDLRKLKEYTKGQEITKKLMIEYKEYLREDKQYKTSSINSFLELFLSVVIHKPIRSGCEIVL